MDQIDAFPEHISTTVMPVTLPEKPDALVYAALQGHVRACILYQEPNTKRARRCLVGENLQRNVEKSRSTPEKYRQEDGVHLQQHVFCEKRLYVWLSNGKVGRDSPDSSDPRAHADL
ncbi:hypothetical protein TNCV_5098891 [Trichonephila clavipes]|uniref:Uncharacterized protein n=1 Tax=Trichonephila clavipes TaxID=2585209 RepID=A0A8X6S7R1_TRICX|nr:hypothetical protein TNCV_5098891 [Trichonephila clavipes]